MGTIQNTINTYQKNFQMLPDIDTSQSIQFMNKATHVRFDLLMDYNTIKNKYSKEIKEYLDNSLSLLRDEISIVNIIMLIFSEIKIFSNKDLLNNINDGIEWISSMFNGYYQRWGLLTENLFQLSTPQFKSPEWIAAFSWKLLENKKDRLFKQLVPFCVSDMPTFMSTQFSPTTSIKDMYENYDIEHYVIFDDGAYSGLQKSTAIFMKTWKELTENITSIKPFKIIIVIPYITQLAVENFRMTAIINNLGFDTENRNMERNYCEWSDSRTNRSVFIWGGKYLMQSTKDVVYSVICKTIDSRRPYYIDMCNDVNNFIINKILTKHGTLGAALCLFEHKLPDFVSLPSVISDFYMLDYELSNHYKRNPPYKYSLRKDPDLTKVFECSKMINVTGGKVSIPKIKKIKTSITYCNKKYTILISKKGNKFILHNNRKVYLKNII